MASMDIEREQSDCNRYELYRARLCGLQRQMHADLESILAFLAAIVQEHDEPTARAPQRYFDLAHKTARDLVFRLETHMVKIDNVLADLDALGLSKSNASASSTNSFLIVDEKALTDIQQGISRHVHFLLQSLSLLQHWPHPSALRDVERFCALAALLSTGDSTDGYLMPDNPGTALHIACMHGELDSVLFLLQSFPRMNLNSTNAKGCTALILASKAGHAHVVRALLDIPRERGLVLDATDTDESQTAVMHAAADGHAEVVQTFLDLEESRRPNLNARNMFGQSVLLLAASKSQTHIVKLLLNLPDVYALDVNRGTAMGSTALMLGVHTGCAAMVELLCADPRVDINAKDCTSQTALMTAVHDRSQIIALQLLAQSSKRLLVNAADKYGMTALMLAARMDNALVVNAILALDKSYALDLYAVDASGRTAAENARWFSNKTVSMLIQAAMEMNPTAAKPQWKMPHTRLR